MDPDLQIPASERKRRSAKSQPLRGAAEKPSQSAGSGNRAARKQAVAMRHGSAFYVSATRMQRLGHLLSVTAEGTPSSDERLEAAALAKYIAGKLDDRGLDRVGRLGPPLKRYRITWADGSTRAVMGRAAAAQALGIKQSTLSTGMSAGGGTYTRKGMVDGSPSLISCQAEEQASE